MSLYTRALRHIDMNRVKELREQRKIAEEELQEEILRAHVERHEEMIRAYQSKHVDWRRELDEGMTTADLGMINLPGEPDTIQTSIPSTSLSSADNLGPPTEDGVVPRVQSFQVVDASKTDTITLNIAGSFTTKTVDGSVLSDKVSVGVLQGGSYGGNYLAGGGDTNGLGSGTHTITIPQKFRKAGVRFDVIQITAFQGESGTVSITGAGLKRVNPMNVFVSLDDPEANAFIRDTLGNENLSPAQKKKKLEQMLGASAEYLIKMFGEGIFTGASEISDVELQQSFADMANAGPSTPVKVDSDGRIVPNMGGGRPANIRPQQGPRQAKTSDNPADWPSRHDLPTGPQGPSKDIPWVPEAPKTDKKKPKQPQYAHYEPEGEVIVEKKLKSPASLLDKIPGYYDGKPAPLGFPIEEPPKMVNGKHPDLVDGKKVSKRYNRLDPISAKAMPPTGNPHIDKKVRAAASKPK